MIRYWRCSLPIVWALVVAYVPARGVETAKASGYRVAAGVHREPACRANAAASSMERLPCRP